MKLFKLILPLLFISIEVCAQTDSNFIRIAFYNLENLFDTERDSLIRDEEFTAEGTRNWSNYRYWEKSNRMAKAILAIGGWDPPAIIGVCEIENRQVLEDLTNTPTLQKSNYSIVHYDSPDRRGIDVGLLYLREKFIPVYSENIAIRMAEDSAFTTRDILFVKGLTPQNDTLHLFICHWPSRYGGQQISELKRITAAKILRKITDSITAVTREPNIIIMGDFNDEWNNKSLKEYLEALPADTEPSGELINLMATLPPNEGSHKYQGKWSYLDQIIISDNLLDGSSLDVNKKRAWVAQPEFLLEKDEKYPGTKPFRTFIGFRYNGGFSDHLPVYIDLLYVE